MEVTHEFVQERFTYDPEGFLVWTAAANNQHIGKRAGYRKKDGYVYIDLFNNKKSVGAHRLIFLWHHGYLPPMLDHINRIKSDNRIENLREATPTQQNANKAINPRSATKHKGVAYEKSRNRYRARIKVQGKVKNIGRFKTPEEAHAAYMKAAIELFGEFACAG